MGNGSSLNASKAIFVEIVGNNEKIVFSRHCGSRDIIDLLAQVAGVSKHSTFTLKDKEGALIAITPTMPVNTAQNAYVVTIKQPKKTPEENPDGQMLQQVLSQVAVQFNKVFKVEDANNGIGQRIQALEKNIQPVNYDEYKNKLEQRLSALENLVQREGLKLLEIEKCKKEISDMKDSLFTAQRKMIDYNHISSHTDDNGVKLKTKSVPNFEKYTLSQETIDYLKQPTFDIWHWEPNEMLSLLEHMYHELGLVKEFTINPIVLKRWLLCVQENYRNNPFHNFRHCFCVTQMMYGIIHTCTLWEKMPREDLGILITACVCHDLDHPGYNNTYQINARTELAVRYNDISPLENHHCAVSFQIMSNPETNIFGNVDHTTFKRIRSGLRFLILATDMSKHSTILDDFKTAVDNFDYNNDKQVDTGIIMMVLATDMARHSEILDSFKSKLDNFDFDNEDHLNSMKMVMIKCCDISNEVRPFEVSEPWVDCLLEEYFNQSDREKEEGLPVAPFMDREKVTKPTAQIGFIKFVLIPMFETIAKLFPQLEDVMVKPLKDARDRYEEMKESDDKNKAH